MGLQLFPIFDQNSIYSPRIGSGNIGEKMASFVVHGPFEIGYEQRKGGRVLVFDTFWQKESDAYYLADCMGCYVFAIRNRSLTPIYVGMTAKSFKQEAFNVGNRNKCNDGFSEYAKGTPVMYFVVRPKTPGPVKVKEIEAIEDFLIQAGAATNPKLQNVRGTQTPSWRIKGVIRSGAGSRTAAESQFISLFDINQ